MRGTIRLLLIVAALSSAACRGTPPQDSLLLITLDTVRADHLSCYGNSPVATPNLDQVARAGARVDRAWTPIPLTTPAHASILTGQYPPTHGVRNNARFRLPGEVVTIAEVLEERGRSTAAFVGSFTTSRMFGLDQGFETYDDDMGHLANGRQRAERRGDEVVDRAISWLRGHASKPFFLWVHLYDAHTPYEPPPEYSRRFPDDPYSGEIAFVDVQAGRLLAALQRSGAAPRTVVAVVGDHGEGLGQHGEAEHGFLLYEATLRVPFIVAAPGRIAAGSRVDTPASLVDLVPTVLGALAVPAPAGVQGIDLLARERERDRGIYAETLYPFEEFGWSALYAFRKGDLKTIEGPRPEFYDLKADPGEERDLSALRANEANALAEELRREASRLVDPVRLAQAVGLAAAGATDPDNLRRLESLGYVGGGGNVTVGEAESLPQVSGRNPRDAMPDLARFDEAQHMLNAGRHEEAVAIFADLRRTDPGNPQVLLKLAQSLQRADRDGDAEACYKELVGRHSTFYLGYRSFSDFLEKRNRPLDSRDLWLRLAERVPGYVGIEARVAQAEIAGGLPADAARRLDSHLLRRPDDAAAWSQLGRAREELRDRSGALDAYRRALSIQPTEADAVRGACSILEAEGGRDEALRLVEGLVERAPGDAVLSEALNRLGGR